MTKLSLGVPGVGKTTTAETLARYLKRHILRINASDFDYERPGQVGSALKKYFQLAHSWGVILLLYGPLPSTLTWLVCLHHIVTKQTYSYRLEHDLKSNRMLQFPVSHLLMAFNTCVLTHQVLLTQVEYFQGVLMLTTNRILSIDIAIQSRLHYAIRFDYLNEEALRAIFETFQAQLDDSNCDTDDREKIRSW